MKPTDFQLFRVELEQVVLVALDDETTTLVISSWRPGKGLPTPTAPPSPASSASTRPPDGSRSTSTTSGWAAVPAPATGCGTGSWGHATDAHSWRSWRTTALIVIGVWATISLASWELLYIWPVWVIGPWGAVLLAQTLLGGGNGNGDERRELGS